MRFEAALFVVCYGAIFVALAVNAFFQWRILNLQAKIVCLWSMIAAELKRGETGREKPNGDATERAL